MRFHRHVTREVRELLTEQLKEYESRTPMSREERRELHDWVAEGKALMIMVIIYAGKVDCHLTSSAHFGHRGNYRIGLPAYQKKKKRQNEGATALCIPPKLTRSTLI